jgi:6,7-dimethyl-8-ribityllumazine synthase
MIKWVHLALQARSEKDFELLIKLLSALGLQARDAEEYSHSRWQTFLPSVAALEVVHRKTPYEQADLELTISDPDSAVDVIKKMGLQIVGDHSGPEPKHTARSLRVQLPGGTKISITGIRSSIYGFEGPEVRGTLDAKGKRFGIVASRFNSFIVERLLSAAIDALMRCRVDQKDSIDVVRVPGSFEIPSAARTLAETKKYDAIICLGCLLRGDTAHYDVIVNEVTRGIGQSAQETGVPHAFGVLTCDTLEQAIDRAGLKMGNKGFEAALAAVEMANLKTAISRQPSAVRKGVVRRPSSVARKNKNVARRASSVVRKNKSSSRAKRNR